MTKAIAKVLLTVIMVLALAGAIHNIIYPLPSETHAASTLGNILCDNFKPFSASANVQLVTNGGTNQFIYICGFVIGNNNAAAGVVSFVEGTGTACATNPVAVTGNSTAAGGLPLAINGSLSYGSGVGAIARTSVAGDNLCLFTGAGPIGGSISWTSAPF